MAWTNSKIFREWLKQAYQVSGTGYTGLDSDTVNVALFNNSATPDLDAARVAVYALFAVVEAALEADPTAGGVIPGPLKGTLTQGDLTESPGEDRGSAIRRASVRWLLSWTSDY